MFGVATFNTGSTKQCFTDVNILCLYPRVLQVITYEEQ